MPKGDVVDTHLQEVNEEIYKRNLELAVVNKTLSLLRKLYQISLLSLDPATLSEKISETVRVDLNMEAVGVFLYDEEKDTLKPFQLSRSDRFIKSVSDHNFTLSDVTIPNITSNLVLDKVIHSKDSGVSIALADIWGGTVESDKLQALTTESHIATVLLYPLVTRGKVIGMLLLGLNRSYDTLNKFEKDSINSFIDVVAIALDKALLYKQLEDANEQLKALDKARAEFISIASHQLRTPPATIKWYVGAVLNGDFGPLNEELKAALQRTNVTNNAQIATIDDLLNASRIERGKLEFFFEKSPLEPVVADLVMQLQPLARMKKLDIAYVPPKEPLPDLLMDKEKIRQVLNNMIDNAIKYSKQGMITVALSKDEANLKVSVTDTGKGIPPDAMESVFEKYARGKDSATHATGLGLGMYVAKIVIEQNNGKIWAESPGEGKGSTFFFTLPIENDLKPTSIDLGAGQ